MPACKSENPARSPSFPRKNVTPADSKPGGNPDGLCSLPPKRTGFRLALRLAGMTESAVFYEVLMSKFRDPIGKLLLIAAVILLAGCSRKKSEAPALSPEAALKSFRLSDDFRIELFVSEPQVLSPVEMVFDENGRIYVAEMLDYPEDPPPGKPARSRIRLLEDRDGDGRIDQAIMFADQVLEVSGLQPWKGGLIVTSAPDILFMKDTNGDGKADERRVLYTGFPKVNPEARITNPRLAMDNWIYAANTGSDGRITSPDHPGRPPVLVRGADFRFRPDRGIAEPASGPAQFGLTFDDWGNRFITQNTVHLRHVVLPMLRPVILIALTIKTLDTYRAFDYLWIMTQGGPGTASTTLNVATYKTAFMELKLGKASAYGLLTMIFPLVVVNLYLALGPRRAA